MQAAHHPYGDEFAGLEGRPISLIDTITVAVSVTGADLLALKKLAVVSGALAEKLSDYRAKAEQTALTRALLLHIHQIEVKAGLA